MLKPSITMFNRKEKFIEKAKVKHNEKYDYSKVVYVNSKTKICIICPEHGEFWQQPRHHLSGSGCPKCKGKNKTTDELIDDFKKVHGVKYDYSQVHFVKTSQKVCVGCETHGYFYVTPNHHLQGVGCPKCGGSCKSNKEEFSERANAIYNNYYDYSMVDYVNAKTRVSIVCPKHGIFRKTPSKHLNGQGCPKCAAFGSKAENEIIEVLQPLSIETHNRTILDGKEIDIYIPSLKLGIEYNGLRWHTENNGKDKHYHLDKLKKCHNQGINLIQIFEDEWVNHKEVWKSMLRQICGISNAPIIDIDKCKIKSIQNTNEIYAFIERNSICKVLPFSMCIGAFYNNTLIGVMTFQYSQNNTIELIQNVSDINHNCQGLEKILFNYFIKKYDVHKIVSFVDRRWIADEDNNIYTSLGFKLDSYTPPNYTLYNCKFNHYGRYAQKELNKKMICEKFNLPLTLRKKNAIAKSNFTKVWDCGQIKYIYEKDSSL